MQMIQLKRIIIFINYREFHCVALNSLYLEHRWSNTDDWHTVEITINNPDTVFLKNETQVSEFGIIIRSLLATIRTEIGHDSLIHIFPAIPAPIAVEIGRSCLPKVDPTLVIYDRQKQNDKDEFIKIATL